MFKLFSLILIIGLLTFVQAFDFSIFNIKPNLALVAIVVASFFIADFWEGTLLVLISTFILKFSPGFNKEILIFFLLGIGFVAIAKHLPWLRWVNNILLIILGTFLFYLFLNADLILSLTFLKEMFLNLSFGALFFGIIHILLR